MYPIVSRTRQWGMRNRRGAREQHYSTSTINRSTSIYNSTSSSREGFSAPQYGNSPCFEAPVDTVKIHRPAWPAPSQQYVGEIGRALPSQ